MLCLVLVSGVSPLGKTGRARASLPGALTPRALVSLKAMAASTSCLTELPNEVLEQILLHLPGQDIVKVEVVWCVIAIRHDPGLTRTFRCMISTHSIG